MNNNKQWISKSINNNRVIFTSGQEQARPHKVHGVGISSYPG